MVPKVPLCLLISEKASVFPRPSNAALGLLLGSWEGLQDPSSSPSRLAKQTLPTGACGRGRRVPPLGLGFPSCNIKYVLLASAFGAEKIDGNSNSNDDDSVILTVTITSATSLL